MQYDLDYYENMLRMYAKSGEKIAKIRWEFIELAIKDKTVVRILDYGSGVGFFRAWRPEREGLLVDSYDIGKYPQTGLPTTPFNTKYDIVCFWDVLEHMHDFTQIEPILSNTEWVATSLPIKPIDVEWHDWKHFKPGEHLNYFTIDSIREAFQQYGFASKKMDTPECPPRVDVMSFLFRIEKEIFVKN